MRICLSITLNKLSQIKGTEYEKNYLIEIRLDYDKINLREIIKEMMDLKDRLIITIRGKKEGGYYLGDEADRLEDYLNIIRVLKPGFIDIEFYTEIFEIVAKEAHKKSIKVIGSYHNFRETPSIEKLENIYVGMARTKLVDIIKIVTYAKYYSDNLKILNLLKEHSGDRPLIAFCMGSKGKISRVITPFFGSWLTYAPLDNDKTAPGQIPVSNLCKIMEVFL